MFLADSHTHSIYSFDGHATPLEMCAMARERGVSALAVTDHYDIDGILDGLYPLYDTVASRRAIEEAAAAYAGTVEIYRGIELGQPILRPDEARAFLKENQFDFVIGSCHNLPRVPDFYFLKYEEMTTAMLYDLFTRSLRQLTDTARFPGIDTIAHPLYPLRYMARGGRTVPIDDFSDELTALFSVMRESGVALEMNLKGIRAGTLAWDQEEYILRLFYDCGGRRLTVGTDAHRAADVGDGLAEGYTRLRAIGFTSVLVPGVGGVREISLV